ncbi:carbamoyltransferase N-terminal domain-containing protein [Candidatus Sororendozoicomonas aggregata]|uniref:carbamoyltransferase N-terminal domain-containing protein n=1 Tax=Candidatus Sororendozoicomonas aggregata TaxID=3073239 RepID=UPI002ED269BD
MSKDVFLGINLLHDTSAATIYDNKVVAAVEQERFDGIRHSTSFPKDAIDFCLDATGVKPKVIKGIATTI